jgi:hypothetical protein
MGEREVIECWLAQGRESSHSTGNTNETLGLFGRCLSRDRQCTEHALEWYSQATAQSPGWPLERFAASAVRSGALSGWPISRGAP